MNSKVAIVLVNYNGWEDTIECLESLLRQQYAAFSVTIVDNASSDNSVQNILQWANGSLVLPASSNVNHFSTTPVPKPLKINFLPDTNILHKKYQSAQVEKINLIASGQNKGFAGGNNLATEYILNLDPEVKYIWYLNNDTVVHEEALLNLVSTFKQQVNKGVKLGILGAKLMHYHNPGLIQAIGAKYNKWYGTSKHVGCDEPDQGQYDQNPENTSLDYIVGASMLVSKEFLEQVGLMNPEYFLYFEELDWVIRGRRLGYIFSFSPHSIVYHKEGKSTGGSSKQVLKSYVADYYNISNRITITNKYFPSYRFSVYLSLIGAMLNRVKRGQISRVKMIMLILKDAVFSNARKKDYDDATGRE